MDIQKLLGDEADYLLAHHAKAFPAEGLILPGPDFLSRVFSDSDRSPTVLRNLGTVYSHGRLGRGSSTRRVPASQRTRFTLILRTSASWPWLESAAPLPPLSAFLELFP